MSKTALAMFTDGREHVFDPARIQSWKGVEIQCDQKFIFDDSGELNFFNRLMAAFPTWTVVHWSERRGFAGTIQGAWKRLLKNPCDYVFHLEDDFVLNRVLLKDDFVPNRGLDLREMQGILDRQGELAQIALLRQPWNEQECAAGGIIQLHPEDYTDRGDGLGKWVQHDRFFTTNPCLYRTTDLWRGWPQVEQSEGHYTIELRNAGYHFAFLGQKADPPRVTHVGTERRGTGY